MARNARDLALSYLQSHQVMTLATSGNNCPWAAAVFYVNTEFDLYFLSAGHTRHARNMAQNPGVAATIQEDYRDWATIQGIQLEGTVNLLEGKAREDAIRAYAVKYPFLAGADEQISAALARVNWYCLTPSLLYFIDNTQGLGHRDQVSLA